MNILDIASAACLAVGAAFGIIGAIGILRFPEFYMRLHAAGITDTLCATLILAGLMLQSPSFQVVAKLALVLFFLLLTTPTATHALARSALKGGYPPPADTNDSTVAREGTP